jgi:hypothetical protein
MWRQWRKYGFPREDAVGEARLEENLSRASRRQLTYTGALQAELPTLANQAKEAGKELWEKLRGQQLVVWIDNWYCERFGVNPEQPVASTDLTAMAVLPLSSADDRPEMRTRSHSLPTQGCYCAHDKDVCKPVLSGSVLFLYVCTLSMWAMVLVGMLNTCKSIILLCINAYAFTYSIVTVFMPTNVRRVTYGFQFITNDVNM